MAGPVIVKFAAESPVFSWDQVYLLRPEYDHYDARRWNTGQVTCYTPVTLHVAHLYKACVWILYEWTAIYIRIDSGHK